jgi:hypothetical protein
MLRVKLKPPSIGLPDLLICYICALVLSLSLSIFDILI